MKAGFWNLGRAGAAVAVTMAATITGWVSWINGSVAEDLQTAALLAIAPTLLLLSAPVLLAVAVHYADRIGRAASWLWSQVPASVRRTCLEAAHYTARFIEGTAKFIGKLALYGTACAVGWGVAALFPGLALLVFILMVLGACGCGSRSQ